MKRSSTQREPSSFRWIYLRVNCCQSNWRTQFPQRLPTAPRAIRNVKSTSVRLGVAKNDLLPKLDLLVGSYVAGLEGDSDVSQAFVNQFRDGRPGFNVGFDFEMPIGNRAARAREQRRKWELERSTQQFRVVVETGLTG